MQMEKEFSVGCSRDEAVRVLADDATLPELFPKTQTEVVESDAERKTVRSRYTALGREGVATFHFEYDEDGDIRFEKVCDGRVWRELHGRVRIRERRGKTRVRIDLEGRTKGFVPEFTIRGPMQEQLDQMAEGLRRRLAGGA